MLFSSRLGLGFRVRIIFSVWLVSCYAHVFVLVSLLPCTIVIVTLSTGTQLQRPSVHLAIFFISV